MPGSWKEWNPVADPHATVLEGHARFTILTPRLLRLEWSEDGVFEDRATLGIVHRALPAPEYVVDRADGWLRIDTGELRLRYRPGADRFTAANLEVTFRCGGKPVSWHPGDVDSLNLMGTTRTLDSTNGADDVDLEPGILSRSGWAIVDESDRPLFDHGDPPWVLARPDGERQDWYLFAYGLDYRTALNDFVRVAGRIPLPPRYALGYWWSRYWAYSDDELRGLVTEIADHGIPLDVLVIDMDWHTTDGLSSKRLLRDDAGEAIGWTGYTWNRDLFPDPEAFLRWVHARGLHTALNLHPASGIPPTEERYDAFARAIGVDPRECRAIPYALEDRRWGEALFSTILRPLEAGGVDFWWLDWQARRMNPAVPGLDETFWLNHVFFSMAEERGRQRPLLFHRWGGLGNHRYQIGFSGDSFSTWRALDFQPSFTATASNVGYGWWSHDIGGHQGEDPDPELYLRWLQFGALSPILRTHSTKSLAIERRIWKYPDEFPAMRDAILMRYALAPYIYTAAREAYDTGVSLCRPMAYDHPEAEDAYAATGQYMFGDDLLVSPVTAKTDSTGMALERIWLPPGEWTEWSSGSLLAGGRWIERSFTCDEIPIYARAGSIIPLYPPISNLRAVPDTLILACMPGADGETRIYEDDGITTDYRGGACAWTKVDVARDAASSRTTLRIHARAGAYDGMPERRAYEVRFPSTLPPREVRIDGQSVPRVDGDSRSWSHPAETRPPAGSWCYDGAMLCVRIFTPFVRCDREVVVERIEASRQGPGAVASAPASEPGADADRQLVDGVPGLFARLASAMPAVKAEWNRVDAIANPPAPLLRAASAARRLTYDPDRAAEILRDFRATLPAAVESLATCAGGDMKALRRIAGQIAPPGMLVESPRIRITAGAESAADATVRIEGPEGSTITYTLDGSLPVRTSTQYDGHFALRRTAILRARAFRDGCAGSFPAEAVHHRTFASRWSSVHPPSSKYAPLACLFDGRFGSEVDFHSGWCGWEGEDMALTVDLPGPTHLGSIRMRFLRDQRNWIFAPARVRIDVSRDGQHWEMVYQGGERSASEARQEIVGVVEHVATFASRTITHLKVTAETLPAVPSWHRGAGGRAWVFADELVVE